MLLAHHRFIANSCKLLKHKEKHFLHYQKNLSGIHKHKKLLLLGILGDPSLKKPQFSFSFEADEKPYIHRKGTGRLP